MIGPREAPVIPQESRFESDPEELVDPAVALPPGWSLESPDGGDATGDQTDVRRLVALLRAEEEAARGWASSGEDDVAPAIGGSGLRTRENLVVRDADGLVQAWAGVHDRSEARMVLRLLVARTLPEDVAATCSDALVDWVLGQARAVGAARGLAVQTIDTGAFTGDDTQAALLRGAGFERVRTWWQMQRPVEPAEADLVPDPARWDEDGVVIRLVSRDGGGVTPDGAGLPDHGDLRAVHDVLEESFADHFGSTAETFDEWLFRQREDPGHRWDQWWLAEIMGADGKPEPAGALIGTVSDGSQQAYVSYVGVRAAARGRGVAKRLLRTIVADAARRGRDSVGLEVDSESSTGANGLYTAMGWRTRWTTESWHREVAVGDRG